MLGPQGLLFFLLILLAFGGLVVWIALSRHVVVRILAACLAFIPAMVFGVAVVNRYYDYYQSWNALFSDLSGSDSSVPQLSTADLRDGITGGGGTKLAASDAQDGLLFSATIPWPQGHITRQALIYLPPQYFSKAYLNYRFPAVELLHGSPGQPSAWINVMDVVPTYLALLAAHKAAPAVLVMPNTDGGRQYALQCLNNPGGIQDITYVGQMVPDWVTANLRVRAPGPAWGVGGYSEGGYCAANIALQYNTRFRYAGVLSGYFAPTPSQVPVDGKMRVENVFQDYPALAAVNTPQEYVLRMPSASVTPQFFLAAGAKDPGDVRAALAFRLELVLRDINPPLMIVQGSGHTALVWRAALGPMLQWMTPELAKAAAGPATRARHPAGHSHLAAKVGAPRKVIVPPEVTRP